MSFKRQVFKAKSILFFRQSEAERREEGTTVTIRPCIPESYSLSKLGLSCNHKRSVEMPCVNRHMTNWWYERAFIVIYWLINNLFNRYNHMPPFVLLEGAVRQKMHITIHIMRTLSTGFHVLIPLWDDFTPIQAFSLVALTWLLCAVTFKTFRFSVDLISAGKFLVKVWGLDK